MNSVLNIALDWVWLSHNPVNSAFFQANLDTAAAAGETLAPDTALLLAPGTAACCSSR